MPVNGGAGTYAAHALQLALGTVFLIAVVPKARRPVSFARVVAGYQIVPRSWARRTATALILLEVFVATGLLTGLLTWVAALACTGLLLVFLAATTVNLRRGRRIPCGCFGASGDTLSERTLIRLSLLLTAATALLVLGSAAGSDALTLRQAFEAGWSGLVYVLQIAGLAAALLLGSWLFLAPEFVSLLGRSVRPNARPKTPQKVR